MYVLLRIKTKSQLHVITEDYHRINTFADT